MKVLVLCSAGAKRSNLLAFHLKTKGYDALAAGVDMNTPETIAMLCGWADVIVVAQQHVAFYSKIPVQHYPKIRPDVEIGPDIWAERWHPELEAICVREAAKF